MISICVSNIVLKSITSFKGLDFLGCPEALQNAKQILSKSLYLKNEREKEERENSCIFKRILCSFNPINSLNYFSIHFSHETVITFKKPSPNEPDVLNMQITGKWVSLETR